MDPARAFVLEAEIALSDGLDAAAVGAAVTVELCGHWEHEGACRWPHNSAIDTSDQPARFRTLFVADQSEESDVRGRIEASLRGAEAWRVESVRSRPVAAWSEHSPSGCSQGRGCDGHPLSSLHSSLSCENDDGWRVLFHQGTPVGPVEPDQDRGMT